MASMANFAQEFWPRRFRARAGLGASGRALAAPEVVERQEKESSEEGALVFLYSDIRKRVPEWASSGPRDVEGEADAPSCASKEIRDIVNVRAPRATPALAPREAAAVEKEHEKTTFRTACQWQLARG
ncbi:unnamed protein product, partial [Prorocentrum cordatum]